MAKSMTMVNVSGGILIMPGGNEVANRASVELSKTDGENRAVQIWIEEGKLVDEGKVPPRFASELEAVRADLAAATAPK